MSMKELFILTRGQRENKWKRECFLFTSNFTFSMGSCFINPGQCILVLWKVLVFFFLSPICLSLRWQKINFLLVKWYKCLDTLTASWLTVFLWPTKRVFWFSTSKALLNSNYKNERSNMLCECWWSICWEELTRYLCSNDSEHNSDRKTN